jgi:protein-S-isoprenylcysteine O-methyltransferase Ste14
MQGIAVGLGMGSPSVMVYALLGGVVWHVVVRPAEESDMQQRFGQVYDAYRQRVGLWIPKWGWSKRAGTATNADSDRSQGG